MTTISLSVICGDSGVGTLGRLLKSVIDRPDGCMVDEICIAWNGQADDTLRTQIQPFFPVVPVPGEIGKWVAVTEVTQPGVTLRILRQHWHGDFARARNEAFAMCSGDWILWADSDDVIADSSRALPDGLDAINAVARHYGIPESDGKQPSTTLRQFLNQLPWDANLILAPYDYTIDANGNALIRQRMRRILRREVGWIWRAPDGVHELPYPNGATQISSIFVHSLLFRHYPSAADQERLLRNREIIERTRPRNGTYVDGRHAFDVATMEISAGQLDEADATLRAAIANASNEEDIYRYRIVRAHVAMQRGAHATTGLQEAFSAVGVFPERAEAFFIISECFYLAGKWESCVAFYRIGCTKRAQPQDIEMLVQTRIKPHAQAAMALCLLGRPDDALALLDGVPKDAATDPMIAVVKARADSDLKRKSAMDGILDALEHAIDRADVAAVGDLAIAVRDAPSLRGIDTLPRFQELLARVDKEMSGPYRRTEPNSDPERAFESAQPPGTEVVFHDVLVDADLASQRLHRGEQLWNVVRLSDKTTGVAVRHVDHNRDLSHVVFYCPHALVRWDPTTPETRGIGGSESSVVFLAEELARRGHRVTIFCPGGTVSAQVRDGVMWYGLQRWNVGTLKRLGVDIVVSCRAPWALRNPELSTFPVYVWHQDNGYGSQWVWNDTLHSRAKGQLYVSEWAASQLLGEIGHALPAQSVPHVGPCLPNKLQPTDHILGNGIKDEWCKLPDGGRNPKRVIYASDPTRGLEQLLDVWPRVLEREPEAQLDVYCDFNGPAVLVSSALGMPGVEMLRRTHGKMLTSPRTRYHGLIGQTALAHEMTKGSVYAYPGGPMPEGFGVALVQAEACGMAVVAPRDGALPEVLTGAAALFDKGDTDELVQIICNLMTKCSQESRDMIRAATAKRHAWSVVADRFERIVGLK